MKSVILAILLGAAAPSMACEPARLKFEGTSFAQNEIQLEKQEIYFFRGEHNQTSIAHNVSSNQWCYVSLRAAPQEPMRGCLSPGQKKILVLRDSKKIKVATLKALGNSLIASLVDQVGKATGKLIQFTHTLEKGEQVLVVRGWNCPNTRFLSCVGADLKALPNYVSVNESTVKEAVDLSQRLGHYRVSCNGVHEHHLKREPGSN